MAKHAFWGLLGIVTGIFVCLPILGWAGEDHGDPVRALEEKIDKLQQEYDKELQELRTQLEALRAQSQTTPAINKASATPKAEASPATKSSARVARRSATEEEDAEPTPVVGKEKEPKKYENGTETILLEEGGILIPKGYLTIEPSFNYTHFSRNLISISGFTLFEAIVIGRIQVEEIKRDILAGKLTLRYGLLDRLQFDLDVPYLYRRDRIVLPAATGGAPTTPVRVVDDHGIGDLEGGVNFHAIRARNWWPDVLLNIRGKTRTGRSPYELDTETIEGQVFTTELPTGTGHYGLSGGFSLVKAIDPVVLFGSLNYFWNIERDVGGDFGEIDPGNSIEYGLGMAVALSEKSSLNFSFQNIFTDETTQNGEELPESELNAATFFIGGSHSFSPRFSLFTNVGIGLTEDSPDFQVEVSMPMTFSLF